MSGIFGFFCRDGKALDAAGMAPMRTAMARWGPEGIRVLTVGAAGLGQCISFNTAEAIHESLPALSADRRLAFTAQGRLDNRDELLDELAIGTAGADSIADGELMQRAYRRWGELAPSRLLGDWSFAVYDTQARSLFVARDQYGRGGVHYFADDRRFAFASDPRALLALPFFHAKINEEYLAKILVGWPGHGSSDTVHAGVCRLPVGSVLRVTETQLQSRRYWKLGPVDPIRFSRDDEYVEGFLDVFRRAVRAQLRSYRPVGATISAGLDSTSVCAVAASELARAGRSKLTGLTGIPLVDSADLVGGDRISNEWQMADAAANHAGIVHVPVVAERPTPIEAIRIYLNWFAEPTTLAGYAYWVVAIWQEAARRGLGTLLDGNPGNFTISWGGLDWRFGWRGRVLNALPWDVRRRISFWQAQRTLKHADEPWRITSPISPALARRTNLFEQMRSQGLILGAHQRWWRLANPRYQWLELSGSFRGALAAQRDAAVGVESRSPAADLRVMSFVLGIPEEQFTGPPRRWLLRRAMHGLLPDAVRLNERRGVQASDLLYRLRRNHAETESTLSDLETSPIVREYLDLRRMREVARQVLVRQDPVTVQRAHTILLRGIGTGLFLLQLE